MTDTTNNSNYTELAKEFARATDNVKEVAEERLRAKWQIMKSCPNPPLTRLMKPL